MVFGCRGFRANVLREDKMPKAIATAEEHRLDMKTIEGGFIVAKRLTYGEKMQRRAMTAGMKIESQKGKKDFLGEMQLINEQATVFDFQRCILDHNLFKDDDDLDKFDFSKINDIRMLDPRAGEEIDAWLSELNNYEDDDEEGN